MCGICGIVSSEGIGPGDRVALEGMCRTLRHRGPDDEGYYVDRWAALGMRRLSIIDLATGQQPVTNEEGKVWLVFNGEIYNYRELRQRFEREGHVFASQSDSEVIVHAYEAYGERCLQLLNGMFALAIWDTRRNRLFLARDRLGIKPLYYWHDPNHIVFGSELKALMVHPDVPRMVDPVALDQFLTLEYVPSPRTIFTDVRKLLPGHYLIFEAGHCQVEPYWDVPFQEMPNDEATCAEQLADLIGDAVRLQMVSDVPLGAFLSGGLDSSTVVASMSRLTHEPVRTFSIGFADATYNELPYARAVARYFGTRHTEATLQPDIADLAERLVEHLDEPLADFSIFPTYLVSELARHSVKVVLSGDGGDELFGGYDAYVAQKYDRYYRWLPGPLRRRALPALMERIRPQPAKKGLINKAKRFVEGASMSPSLQHARWMMFMSDADKARLYRPALQVSVNGCSASSLLEGYFQRVEEVEPLARQQYVDLKTYLADDILTKVDRMSMAASIEARVPLLDHRIVEFALNLPPHMKLQGGQTKVILRRAMHGRLPEAILTKPKQGFSIPLKHWLHGPLRPMLTDLLSADCVRRRGYFEAETVTRWVTEHLDGRANHSHRLWALMVFELWQRQVLGGGRK